MKHMNAEMLAKLQAMWPAPPGKPADTRLAASQSLPAGTGAIASMLDTQANLQERLGAAWSKPNTSPATPAVLPPVPIATNPAIKAVTPVFIDLETQSVCDIELGGRRYAADPTTRIVSVVAMLDKQVVVWTPQVSTPLETESLWPPAITPVLPITVFAGPDCPEPLRAAAVAGRPFCAHNASGFDTRVWRAMGLPEPRAWIDTLPMARAAGLPGKLDALGLRLFGVGKDEAGKKALKKIRELDKDGRLPTITTEQLAKVVRYNIQDVALLVGVHTVVTGCGEPDVIQVDAAINERGIAFDRKLAAQLIELEAAAVEPLCLAMETATGGAIRRKDLNRLQFLRRWLAGKGVVLDNLQRETVQGLLAAKPGASPEVRAVLQARLANSRITTSKLETALSVCGSDGRLRDQLVYHGAHTGRWSGRGMQPHNLPRPNNALKDVGQLLPQVESLDAFVRGLPAGVSVADGLSALIRPCFVARPGHVLAIADFAGIEARGVAWCASEQHQLELFGAGGDNYCDLASQIYGYAVTPALKRERAVGKIAVLGCGYGMGADKFAGTAAKMGVDLATANTSAEAVVETYRDRYPAIAGVKNSQGWREGGLWKNLEQAARQAINGRGPIEAGTCLFLREGDDLLAALPGGRRMYYRNARIERRIADEEDARQYAKPSIVFDTSIGTHEVTYGGKLTENIVSAICRDLLATALVQCDREGLPVVLHVHDEIVLEVPVEQAEAALRRLLAIMSTPPAWACGFPIEVEGFWADRYFKTPPVNGRALRARQGRVLATAAP
jgi:DNA polymerase